MSNNLDHLDSLFEFGHERSQEFEEWLDEIHSMAEAERIEEEIILNSHRHSATRPTWDKGEEVPF